VPLQVIVVVIPTFIALLVSYVCFENNFNYFLYMELIFLTFFIGLNIIDYYYLTVVIIILAIVIYRAVEPRLNT